MFESIDFDWIMEHWLALWVLAFFLLASISYLAQKTRLKRGKSVKKKNLSIRSKIAIIFAGGSVVAFMLPIKDYNLLTESTEAEFSIQHDVRQIRYWENVPIRHFVEGIYSREELDLLENDFIALRNWMDDNVEILHDKMSRRQEIKVDSLQIPIPESGIDNPELTLFRESFLAGIDSYNQDVAKYYEVQNKKYTLQGTALFYNCLMSVLMMIAMVLQFNVLFWNDRRDDE